MTTSLNKCRLCLRLGRFGSIFEEDDSVKFSDMVMAIANIEITEDDGLPWHVCSLCVESLSAAYVFRCQCLRADLHIRTQYIADKSSSEMLNASYSGLLNQDFHLNSHLDCSAINYDENVMENKINKDIVAHSKPTENNPEQMSDSEVEANSMKCLYCDELLCNVEVSHDCQASSSKQTSDSDETIIMVDKYQSQMHNSHLPKKGPIKCLLCDQTQYVYQEYVTHLLECTANVRIQYYECSACHDLSVTIKSYLQHVKIHFNDMVQSVDCVDSTKREDELMQKLAPPKPKRYEIGWSQELFNVSPKGKSPMKETKIPKMVKTFLGLNGAETYPKHSSPAKESIRKFIQAGRDKTANYHCFGRGGKKLKKKVPKYRNTYRKNVERKLLFASKENIATECKDQSNTSHYFDAMNESYSTLSETSTSFVSANEPIYAVVEKKKVFMLSDFLKERDAISRMLLELGAEVASNTSMEMRASHFICVLPRDTCSGMMVCALATGKWVLHYSYVTDSFTSKKLLSENAYEWAHHPRLPRLNSTSIEAAKASEYWRVQLRENKKKFPFQGARVVLIMERKYYKYYKFIFKTLKAKVILYNQKELDACVNATHCFVDMKSIDTSDLMFFTNHNIPVYPYQYILIYLLKCGNVPDEHKYLLQECKMLKMSSRLNKTC